MERKHLVYLQIVKIILCIDANWHVLLVIKPLFSVLIL